MRVISWIRLDICPKLTSNQNDQVRDSETTTAVMWDAVVGILGDSVVCFLFVCKRLGHGVWMGYIYICIGPYVYWNKRTYTCTMWIIHLRPLLSKRLEGVGFSLPLLALDICSSWKQRARIAFTIHTFSYMIESMFKTDSSVQCTHWLEIMNCAICIYLFRYAYLHNTVVISTH